MGIPITPPLYGYYWVLSSAQIQLLSLDVPVTTYPKDKKTKIGKGGRTKFTEPSAADVTAAAEKWRKKYEGRTSSVSINDLI